MSAQLLELKKNLKAEIAASLNREGELSDAALYQTIDEKLLSRDDLSLKNKLYLRNAVFNSFRRLDVLQELLDNPAITEIMINSDKEIFVEAGGRMQRWDKQFESGDQLEEIINILLPIRLHCKNPLTAFTTLLMMQKKMPSAFCERHLLKHYTALSQ